MQRTFSQSNIVLFLVVVSCAGCYSPFEDLPTLRIQMLSPTPGPESVQAMLEEPLHIRATITDAEAVTFYEVVLFRGAGQDRMVWSFPIDEPGRPQLAIDTSITLPASYRPSAEVGLYTLDVIAHGRIAGATARARLDLVR